jgi:hypothetical protein
MAVSGRSPVAAALRILLAVHKLHGRRRAEYVGSATTFSQPEYVHSARRTAATTSRTEAFLTSRDRSLEK